jgi:hypothetical protein
VQEHVLSALLTEMDGIGVQRDSLSTMCKTYLGSKSVPHSQVVGNNNNKNNKNTNSFLDELCRVTLLRFGYMNSKKFLVFPSSFCCSKSLSK